MSSIYLDNPKLNRISLRDGYIDARAATASAFFLTSEAKLLTLDQGKLMQANVPFRVHPVRLNSLGGRR
jgi:hypothetical protein